MKKQRDFSVYIGILVGLIIGGLGLFFITAHLIMNDAFWHIKTGEWVSQVGFIDKCYGSWVLSEDSWTAHEWLFGWIIYQISKCDMDNIVRIFGILYLLTLCVCLFQTGLWRKQDKPPMLYWELVLIVQFCIYAVCMSARPQYITAILIALYLFVLNKSQKGQYKLLYLLPVLAVLWVNIHGGTSLLSYITILVYLLCNVFQWDIGNIHFQKAENRWIIHCMITLSLTVAALFINPYGYEMLLYPYVNMQDRLMISMIAEWSSPDAKDVVILLFQIIPMLLGIVALIQYQGKIKAHDIALFFMYIILYLRSVRFYPFLVVVQTCLITPYAFQVRVPFAIKNKRKIDTSKRVNNILLILCGIFCIGYMIIAIVTADYDKIEKNKELPEELMEQICQDTPKRLCNHYDIGGYLLYHDIDVFMDGRYEPYKQHNIIEDYLAITNPENMEQYHEMEEIIKKYDFDAFLISTGNVPLAVYLEENSYKYELSYEDEKWLYYKRIAYE